MRSNRKRLVSVLLAVPIALGVAAEYRTPEKVVQHIQELASRHKDTVMLHNLGRTPGKRDLVLLELGKNLSDVPAILVAANMEGNNPMSTEAALMLADRLVTEWKTDISKTKWYILPLGNPDGYARFFSSPLAENCGNERSVNDDNDDAADEDGPEDLNGDGWITTIRQNHPEGQWMAVPGNPVLMKKADGSKGEIGVYRLFTEGLDNDKDGRINEDGPGGVIPGRNFPHEFQFHSAADGRWPASEEETRSLLRFAFDHPEIAMMLVFGKTNSLQSVPAATRQAQAGGDKYKVPKQYAEFMGLDPDVEYPIQDLLEMAREATGYRELTEDMLLQFLGVGAAVNPHQKDLAYWNEISKQYNDFVKEAGFKEERLKAPAFSSGSLEEWSYYQYGVPTFSMDFWTLPLKKKETEKKSDFPTPDEIEKMSNDDFIALGEEKIDAYLKESGAPAQFKAAMLINALKSGMMDTKRMAKMMRENQKKEDSGGIDEKDESLYAFNPKAYLEWKPFDHPTLGKVEIGGKIPYAELPSAAAADSVIGLQLPFVRELAKKLPQIAIENIVVTKRADDVWKVEAWIRNKSHIPYPTYQGDRCKRPTPVVVTLFEDKVIALEGKKRVVVGQLDGGGGSVSLQWLLRAPEGTQLKIEAFAASIGRVTASVTLKGGN